MSITADQAILSTLDQWAGLSHKTAMTESSSISLAPSWVPAADRRRLAAYTILAAYVRNVSRVLLTSSQADRDNRREYGDPDLLVKRVVGAILGDQTQIVVDGGDQPPPMEPVLPPAPPVLPDDASDLDRRIHRTRQTLWDTQAAAAVDEWETAWDTWPALHAHQTALTDWAADVMLDAVLLEWNRDAVELGDGIVELAISTARRRPIINVYDPGFYFPVLDDSDGSDYPSTVHFAWEIVDDTDRKWIRRRTLQRVPLDQPRRYPYAPDTDSWHTVLLSDARWPIDRASGVDIPDLNPAHAIFEVNEDGLPVDRLDTMMDFIPVVHLPNTPTGKTHFGESILVQVAQIFDDLQEADSDYRLAGGLAAVPILAASGDIDLPPDLQVTPGQGLNLGKDGRLDVVDMSGALPELAARKESLLDRLAVNSRVSAEVMGRVDSSTATSGFAMLLGFGPFTQLISDLRLTRHHKHALLLKFAGRMMQMIGTLEPGVLAPASIVPGAFLPANLTDVVNRVVALLDAHAISRQTALAMLTGEGVTVDDAAGELARIRAEDTVGAKNASDATTSSQVGADWLGVTLPEPPSEPSISMPG